MSNILTHDASEATEVVESRAAEEADSLRVGEELAQAQEQLLAGKYKDAQELEKAYIELQTKLGDQSGESQQQSKLFLKLVNQIKTNNPHQQMMIYLIRS